MAKEPAFDIVVDDLIINLGSNSDSECETDEGTSDSESDISGIL